LPDPWMIVSFAETPPTSFRTIEPPEMLKSLSQ
jgi:hypothetical protein